MEIFSQLLFDFSQCELIEGGGNKPYLKFSWPFSLMILLIFASKSCDSTPRQNYDFHQQFQQLFQKSFYRYGNLFLIVK